MQKELITKALINPNNFLKLKRILQSKTETGKRQKNEDYVYCGSNKLLDNLLIVCDGLGSYRGSEKAAEIVSKTFIKSFLKQEYLITSINEWFEINIKNAKLAMRDHILRFSDDFQMSTTLVLALTVEDFAYIFWIGDSRAYLLTKKEDELLTRDHNLLNYLIDNDADEATIESEGPNLHSLTNSITIDLKNEQKYDATSFRIKKNSYIFLASDGFYNFYKETENLFNVLNSNEDKNIVNNSLVEQTLKNESNDNISFSYLGFLK